MFSWVVRNKNPILLTLLIWLFPTILSLSFQYIRKQAVFSSGKSAEVQGISSTFQPTPDDYKYLDGSTVGYESNSYFIWLSDTQSLLFVLTWASTGYYSQMQLTYQLFTAGQKSTVENIVSCDTNSITKKLDSLYIQTSCMDFVTSIYSKNIIQFIKFHPDSGINGEVHFVSIDRGIKAWNPKGKFILNPDSGQYCDLFFNVFNQVEGSLAIAGYNKPLEVNGVGIFRREKMGVLPSSFYQRYNIFYFKSNSGEGEDIQFFLFQFYPAKGFQSVGPSGIGYSFLYKNNKLQFVTSDFNYTLIDGKLDSQSNYRIPTSMTLNLKSGNLSTSEIRLSSKSQDLNLFIGIDCLEKPPSVIKTLIKTFVTKPYLYVYLFPSSITYKDSSANSSKVINGTVYMNTNYL